VTRREILTAAGSAAFLSALCPALKPKPVPSVREASMAARPPHLPAHSAAEADEEWPAALLRRISGLLPQPGPGWRGMAMRPTDPDLIRKFHDKVQTYDMHVIFNVPLPRGEDDVARFGRRGQGRVGMWRYGLHAAMTAAAMSNSPVSRIQEELRTKTRIPSRSRTYIAQT